MAYGTLTVTVSGSDDEEFETRIKAVGTRADALMKIRIAMQSLLATAVEAKPDSMTTDELLDFIWSKKVVSVVSTTVGPAVVDGELVDRNPQSTNDFN